MNLRDCHNFGDFRKLAKKKLPSPIFHYIDGGSDDEVTLKRNTEAFNDCDLIPNVLAEMKKVDLSTTLFGEKMKLPFFLAPTAMQRLFHHDGEIAVAKAAEKLGTMFGVSSLGTASIEEVSKLVSTPKLFYKNLYNIVITLELLIFIILLHLQLKITRLAIPIE